MAWLDLQEGILETFAEKQAPYSANIQAGINRWGARIRSMATEAQKDWRARLKLQPEKHAEAKEKHALRNREYRKEDPGYREKERARYHMRKKRLQNTKEGLG